MSQALTREIEELRLLMGSPRDPHGRVFAQLGDALRRAGSHREALTVLLDGVTEHPNFSPGHLVLGWTAQEAGDITVARTAYERTLELDPENPKGLFGLGSLLDREGDPRGADLIEEAESLDSQVRATAPSVPEGSLEMEGEAKTAERALEGLPFLSLEEMAPDMPLEAGDPPGAEALDDALFGLPFVSLEELAPNRGEAGEAETDAVEFEAAWGDQADASEMEAVGDYEGTPPEADGPTTVDEVAEEALDGRGHQDPEASLDTLPFVSLEELRPEPESEDEAASAVQAESEHDSRSEHESWSEPESGSDAEPSVEPDLEATTPVDRDDREDDQLEEDFDLAGPLATRTMGELLVRQGLTAEAVGVFETLVERSPDDEDLRGRLNELRLALGSAGEATSVGEGDFDGPAEGTHEANDVVDDVGGETATEDDLRESAAHPSMDPPVPHPEVPSPFHLGAGEAEEGREDEGEEVGDYFSRLLGWAPGHQEVPGEAGGPSQGGESDSS